MAKSAGKAIFKSGKDYLSLPGESLVKVAEAYFNYKKTCVVEERRRAEIEAWREITVTSIKEYFDKVGNIIQNAHEEKMKALNVIDYILREQSSSLPPEILLEFTRHMVELIKSDNINESIKSLRSNLESRQTASNHERKSLLDQNDIIDI